MFVSPDPASQLVQIRQAEDVRLVDEHRVGSRNVDAVFDDGGRDEDVELLGDKLVDYLFQFALFHLAVAYADPRLGHEPAKPRGCAVDRPHAVVHEVDLPVAAEFPEDRMSNLLRVRLDHLRLYRPAVDRWCRQGADITNAKQPHVQCARDRCGGQRQYVDCFA